MNRYLICYSSSHGQTRKVAEFMAKTLIKKGASAELVDIRKTKGPLDTTGAKAVFLGSFVHAGSYPGAFLRFTTRHLPALRQIPVRFFTVCLAARSATEDARKTLKAYADSFMEKTGLQPASVGYIGGALPYTRYNFLIRFLLKKINETTGGDTDTSRDFEYTDWNAVEKFVLAGM